METGCQLVPKMFSVTFHSGFCPQTIKAILTFNNNNQSAAKIRILYFFLCVCVCVCGMVVVYGLKLTCHGLQT